MTEPKRYAYKPSEIAAIFGSVMFFGGALLMFTEAQSGDSVTINQLITMSPDQAKLFFWVMTIACVVLGAFFILACYRIMTRKSEIILDATTLTVPPSPFASESRVIPLDDIVELLLVKAGTKHLLRLRLPQSQLDLNVGFFEDEQAYQSFGRDLALALNSRR